MQFVQNGPDIPDSLLLAHEEGRVVFFCGAGISYPARLPGFADLVKRLYAALTTLPNPVQQAAIKAGQFDTAVGLLEGDVVGGREVVRRELAKILTPDLSAPNAMATHEALLALSKSREGRTRLITTNFDRLFEEAILGKSLPVERFHAPLLPVPKNRWDGLVYLHGLLTEVPKPSALDRLVVSSGDFGLAYLTERWAARFVSELFRNYTVCFVGYSINDPVLRYMMDALAADRLLGESHPEMFAFGSYSDGNEVECANEWRAKNVTPILYLEDAGHAVLHKTLKTWADTYRDGILGKERIVLDSSLARPSASTRQDDFVGRMLWALSHESGLPAKRFADINPVPPLEWLEAFSDDRYWHGDLIRFGVRPNVMVDEKLRFSLIRRPAPYSRAAKMALVSGGCESSQWDPVMYQLARWLVRHLNDPELILWLAKHGGRLHDSCSWLIENELNGFARLEREGKTNELDEIRANAPNAIPGPVMQTLWRLMLSGRVKAPWREVDLYGWKERLKREGLTTTLRLELRELLAPKIKLKRPLRWGADDESPKDPTRIKQLVEWELVLAADHVNSSLRDLSDDCWRTALPPLVPDLQQLLKDALDLMQELGDAEVHRDSSFWDLPSISPHWQNRGFRDWVTLIELLRDAWLATHETDPDRAVRIAQGWFDLPYPVFKRLALFAASLDGCISSNQWVEWLVADSARWLWSVETRRETMRLLVLQAPNLSAEARVKLETAMLAGPPRNMFKADLEQEGWQSLVDRLVWMHLAKLYEGSRRLDEPAKKVFECLSTNNPDWMLASNESDEFSHWMSGTGDPDYKASLDIDIAPRKRRELVDWLKQQRSEHRPFYEDTWSDTCRTRFFHCFLALCDLTREGLWPVDRWREALQVWSEDGQVLRSWRFAAPLMQTMSDSVMQENVHSVTYWMEMASKSMESHEDIMLDLCRRVFALPLAPDTGIRQNGEPINQPVTDAINHPIGRVTQVLLNLWLRREPNDNESLPKDIEPFFTKLSEVGLAQFCHGRVLLASRLIALFRVDQSWTEKNLLPLFDWDRSSIEAKAAWEGFLWSPRLYRPLLLAFKSQFLATSHHYTEIGEHRRQFATFLTYAALDPVDGYALTDFQLAIAALPQEGLEEVVRALSRALEGAGEQREEYWKNRVQPFWHKVWPKSRAVASSDIAESLTRLCIAARGEFPSALAEVVKWLQPLEHPGYVFHLLQESRLAERCPEDVLTLLRSVLDEKSFISDELPKFLAVIALAKPILIGDLEYKKIVELSRRRGC
jgi:hypothetical protein